MKQIPHLKYIILGFLLAGFLTALISILGNVISVSLAFLPLRVSLPLLGVSILALGAVEVWRFRLPSPSNSTASTEDPLNRRRMLDKVQAKWITGFLEDVLLYGDRLLEPRLQVRSTHWELALQHPDDPAHSLPTEKDIIQLYDEAQGELLILGNPGSGKTTLLLKLARELIQRARQHDDLPIPVVLNLSSWAVKRQRITDWLVEELYTKYQVPRQLGQGWVEEGRLLLLLDGLDEVAPNYRSACIEAVNSYRRNRPGPIVVSSRKDDYLEQPERLHLRTVVTIQQLTPEQIEAYLSQFGDETAALQDVLSGSKALQDLAETPFLLKVLILACHGKTARDIQKLASTFSPEDQQQLFDAYVQRMLQAGGTQQDYLEKQTISWLGWLARQLNGQTEFYLEQLQPVWLPTQQLKRYYNRTVRLSIGLTSGLLSGLVCGLAFGLDVWRTSGVATGLFVGLIGGLFTAGVSGLVYGMSSRVAAEIEPVEVVWSWASIRQRLEKVEPLLGVGLVSGLVVGVLKGLENGLGFGVSYGLAGGLALGILAVLVGTLLYGLISKLLGEMASGEQSRQTFATSHPGTRSTLRHRLGLGWRVGLIGGMHFGLIFGLIIGILTVAYELENGVTGALFILLVLVFSVVLYGLVYGLFYGLIIGVVVTQTSRIMTDISFAEVMRQSWRSIWQRVIKSESWSNILVFSLVFGIDGWLTEGVMAGLVYALVFGLVGILLYWLLSGLIGGLSPTELEERTYVVPNQGIRHSAWNSVTLGVVFGLLGMLFFGLVGILIGVLGGAKGGLVLYTALFLGLPGGVITGLAVGLPNGGITCIQHVVLRLFLWDSGNIPWKYVRFLDYAAERFFLRKIGGGYVFLHKFLRDHFARSLPCGHQRRTEQARFCSVCGAPVAQGANTLRPGDLSSTSISRHHSRINTISSLIALVLVLVFIGISAITFLKIKRDSGTPLATAQTLSSLCHGVGVVSTDVTSTTSDGQHTSPSGLPVDPRAAAIVTHILTASAVDNNNCPTKLTNTFRVKQIVYITFDLRLQGKTGYVVVKWYGNNNFVFKDMVAVNSLNDVNGYFGVTYIASINGEAELYWCTKSDCSDARLAGFVDFKITSS
jgi:NACHT domain